MILAIDPGLASTGWALVDGTRRVGSGTVHTKPKDYQKCSLVARCEDISHGIKQGIGFNKNVNTVIEQPYSGQFKGGSETYFVAGFLAHAFMPWVMMVNPNTWAKGKAEQKRNEAVLVYKVKTRTSEHERDALAIALWAATGGIK